MIPIHRNNTLTPGARTFTYDSENRLMNGGAVSLVYDGRVPHISISEMWACRHRSTADK